MFGKKKNKNEEDEQQQQLNALLQILPSEQDRKATLGCLAACLNMMYSHQNQVVESKKKADKGKKKTASEGGDDNDKTINEQHKVSLKQDAIEPLSSSTTTTTTTTRSPSKDQRTQDFQKELLILSADLLFLPPDYATVSLPSLDIIIFSDDSKEHEKILLDPLLESLSSQEAAFQCLALLLFRFLLVSSETSETGDSDNNKKSSSSSSGDQTKKTIVGYDSRVRYVFKYLAVSILSYFAMKEQNDASGNILQLQNSSKEIEKQEKEEKGEEDGKDKDGEEVDKEESSKKDNNEDETENAEGTLVQLQASANAMRLKSAKSHATRKFEALEDTMAQRLSWISQWVEEQQKQKKKDNNNDSSLAGSAKQKSLKQQVVRGMKVGAAGVAAGTLFAITGGIAAPALAAGIATLTGAGAFTSLCISLITFPAATTLFGVGGGSLVASKMNTRTKGLSGFKIEKVSSTTQDGEAEESNKKKKKQKDDVSSTAQTPELSRTVCISGWLLDEHDFRRPFGVTPQVTDKRELLCRFCSVYAPEVVPECKSILKEWEGKEDELWDMLRTSYGKDPDTLLPLSGPRQEAVLSKDENQAVDTLIGGMGFPISNEQDSSKQEATSHHAFPPVNLLADVLSSAAATTTDKNHKDGEEVAKSSVKKKKMSEAKIRAYKAWDFQAEFGGEQYIVSWDTKLLLELNKSVQEMTAEMAKSAAEQVLKKTALASIMAAVALPSTLLAFTNVIDDQWTLAAERADEAGIVLAHTLLDSGSGHRPVTLVGFSFGARIILSCLQELAKQQDIWEQEQQKKFASPNQSLKSSTSSSKSKNKTPQPSREPASVVEDVVLMGCPASVTSQSWAACRRVTAGRLVNCHSKNDMMLALMYRIKNMTKILNPPAGIIEVNQGGVENYDVSAIVSGHTEYCHAVKDILHLVGLDQPRA